MSRAGKLPSMLPIFPLTGVILLPGAHLPLRVFEYRYLEMTADVIESHRMVGIIQPRAPHRDPVPEDAPIFDVGCCGHLVDARELQDGSVAIALDGVSRFKVLREVETVNPYREVMADFDLYAADRDPIAISGQRLADRAGLLAALETYLPSIDNRLKLSSLSQADDEELATVLTMVLPFTLQEKQALLEAPDLSARGQMLTALLRFANAGGGQDGAALQ